MMIKLEGNETQGQGSATKGGLMGRIGATEIILIVVIILLLFGAKRIPQLMRSLGTGVREFKKGVRGEDEESEEPSHPEEKPPEKPQG